MMGNLRDPQVVFVCDAPHEQTWSAGEVMSNPQMSLLRDMCRMIGIKGTEVALITAAPPIPETAASSDKRTNEFLSSHRDEFIRELDKLTTDAKLIVAFGKTALYQLHGKSVKITKCRGTLIYADEIEVPILPCFSPSHVLRSPEVKAVWESDLRQIIALRESNWDVSSFEGTITGAKYEWVTDLSKLLANPPRKLAVDTETLGFKWHDGRKILIVQMSYQKGHSLIVPLNADYFNNDELRGETTRHLPKLKQRDIDRLESQLTELLGNPDVAVVGHNFKFDLHHLANHGIGVANFAHDTIQLAFCADDNMQSKSLDDCVRRWVGEMSGYADGFNTDPIHQDKERMDLVPHDMMTRYAGGDTDACFRLAERLLEECRKDSRNFRCYERIQMPGLRAFFKVERAGLLIDQSALRRLGTVLEQQEKEAYSELITMAAKKAPSVLRKHEEAGLSFGRAEFLIDLLFTPEGFGIEPIIFTKTTEALPPEQRVPSTSSKQHLPFFEHIPFVHKLIEYKKLTKLRSTYVGLPSEDEYERIGRLKNGAVSKAVAEAFKAAGMTPPEKDVVPVRVRRLRVNPVVSTPNDIVTRIPFGKGQLGVDRDGQLWRINRRDASGFWQYLTTTGKVHTNFRLDNVVTGRSSSRDPNFQNLPNRGEISQVYRGIFIPRKVRENSYSFIECDLSQAEIRIAAWMAHDPVMLKAYNEGVDIHALTAAKTLGLTIQQFNQLDKAAKKEARQKAKGVNFGFLYGMWWKSFKTYAFTQYGVKFTDKQAEAVRELYFETYPSLGPWHDAMKEFANKNRFVRALHGSLRRLPGINSNDKSVRMEAERQAINSPVQRFASDLGIMAMARFTRDCPADLAWIVAFIHDALVAEAKTKNVREVASYLKFYMQSNPLEQWFGITPPLPIIADVKIGHASLGAMEEIDDIEAVAPPWWREDLDAEFSKESGLIGSRFIANFA